MAVSKAWQRAPEEVRKCASPFFRAGYKKPKVVLDHLRDLASAPPQMPYIDVQY